MREKSNTRVLIGLGLVLVVAPFAESFYTIAFNYNDRVAPEVWYYESWFWLFMSLGPYLAKVFNYLAVFFVFCGGIWDKRAYLVAIPVGLAIGKIIWLLQVTSHEEFHRVTPWQFVLYGCGVSVSLIFIVQYLEWRFHHRKRAHECRLGTINKAYEYQLLDKATLADQYYLTVKEMEARNY